MVTAQAVGELRQAKQQIMASVTGRVPGCLALATVQAAVRLARREAAPAEVLSERVVELVRQSLAALAQTKWKLDTALLLQQRRKEGGRDLPQ